MSLSADPASEVWQNAPLCSLLLPLTVTQLSLGTFSQIKVMWAAMYEQLIATARFWHLNCRLDDLNVGLCCNYFLIA